jgi:hypothetical protein
VVPARSDLLGTAGAEERNRFHATDLDSRGGVTLTATRMTTAGPPAAGVADALAGRPPAAAVLSDLPGSSRGALSLMADFFNSPVEQSRA